LTTDEIRVPVPDEEKVNLALHFGAGELTLSPGGDGLVSGTATYNLTDFKPTVTTNAGDVLIDQGNYTLNGIPDWENIRNEWKLKLGDTPMDLTIEAGAYKAEYEFGGLSLTNLTVKDGAAEVKLTFSEPNNAEMKVLRYETGASNVTLKGLANANFALLEFDSGAGNYTLEFTGSLKRDASVNIQTGLSNLTLVIPAGIPVQITVEGGLANTNMPGNWSQNGKIYTQDGEGPALTIIVEIGAGNLTVTQ
jgi:hypothetical protein